MKTYKNYTEWVLALVLIILNDNNDMTIDEISLSEGELMGYYTEGVLPEVVYGSIWQGDAGNYFKCF